MRFGLRQLRALRRVRPGRSVLAVGSVGTAGLAAVAVAISGAGSTAHSAVRPVASPSASATAPAQPLGDFADFQAVKSKPAAAAPIRKLPRVRLSTVTVDGIPPVPLAAYRRGARMQAAAQPTCRLPWWLLAGIGFVESGHARSGGSAHVGWNGVAHPPIYGPVLKGGHGYASIPDTDGGRLDGDRQWDRAVGPMQFLPSTWRTWGPPGRFEGKADPQNIFAATRATAGYLCASGSDVSQPHAMALAVYSYNHSFNYVRLVLSVGARYAGMSPDQLGVNLLPKDDPKAKHHRRHHHRHARRHDPARGTKRSAAATASASSSPSPSSTPSPSPSATPSPSPSRQPLPNPLPSLTPPVIGR